MDKRRCIYCKNEFAPTYIQRHLQTCQSKSNYINGPPSDELLSSSDDEGESIDNIADSISNHNDFSAGEGDDLDETYDDFTIQQLENEDISNMNLSALDELNQFPLKFLLSWCCLFLAFWQRSFVITDNALELLIKFFKNFVLVLSRYNQGLIDFSNAFPGSLYQLRQYLGTSDHKFTKYVVCRKCFSLYQEEECVTVVRGENVPIKCKYKQFPDHPLPQHRSECGESLVYEIKLNSGKKKLVPYKYYIYNSFKKSFEELLSRPGIEEKCEQWRSREIQNNIFFDVYDGNIWKRFSGREYSFLNKNRHYGFMINVDWFCPFKHVRSYSVGAIYLACMNLPRSLRFKQENIILVGLIPNMKKEPPTNTFLEPLVSELYKAWYDGYTFTSKVDGYPHLYKAALLCVGCDIPATRKLCGFLGHSATMGCSKCKKSFPGQVGQKDYGGFDRENWQPRCNRIHRSEMNEILQAKTKGEQEALERRYGTRFTVLSVLPYFDCIDMVTVDPMHNLFLGTSKLMVKIWSEKGYLTKDKLEQIQKNVDLAKCPSDVGKLPKKIDNFSFDGFTADEFKNWTIIFSLYVLHGIIPHEELECWRKFVLACSLLCCRAITVANVIVADNLLLEFCRRFERLYPGRVTPNIHLHNHIAECIRAYGPIYSFWLFSFERYNGIIGGYPTNNRNIELQLMKRFDQDRLIMSNELPVEESDTFSPLFDQILNAVKLRGTLSEINHSLFFKNLILSSRNTDYRNIKWFETGSVTCAKSLKPYIMTNLEHTALRDMYSKLYPNFTSNMKVTQSGWRFPDVTVGDENYSSEFSRSDSSAYVTSFWCGSEGEIQSFNRMYFQPRPGKVRYFLKHTLEVGDHCYEHILASVHWYLPLDDAISNFYGKPIKLWRNKVFELTRSAYFLPVQRIKSKFIPIETKFQNIDVLVALPRDRYLNI